MSAATKRSAILDRSLATKRAAFDAALGAHTTDVRAANGQPMNDKRNGCATSHRWDRQNDRLRSLDAGIKRTEAAIAREESKAAGCELAAETFPTPILALIADGTLRQWRRHPHILFVAGVDRARLVWSHGRLGHDYIKHIPDQAQYAIFRDVFNAINASLRQQVAA